MSVLFLKFNHQQASGLLAFPTPDLVITLTTTTRSVIESSFDTFRLTFCGELDSSQVGCLNMTFEQSMLNGDLQDVVLNLREVTFVDSAGWRCIENFVGRLPSTIRVEIFASPCVTRLVGTLQTVQGTSFGIANSLVSQRA
jgi:ABC-type transporter Mla MlaB component